jgi:hypothetical protein
MLISWPSRFYEVGLRRQVFAWLGRGIAQMADSRQDWPQ